MIIEKKKVKRLSIMTLIFAMISEFMLFCMSLIVFIVAETLDGVIVCIFMDICSTCTCAFIIYYYCFNFIYKVEEKGNYIELKSLMTTYCFSKKERIFIEECISKYNLIIGKKKLYFLKYHPFCLEIFRCFTEKEMEEIKHKFW